MDGRYRCYYRFSEHHLATIHSDDTYQQGTLEA